MSNEQTTPYGYCHCGGGEKTRIAAASNSKRGVVRGEPLRFVHSHNARPVNPDGIEPPDHSRKVPRRRMAELVPCAKCGKPCRQIVCAWRRAICWPCYRDWPTA